jgi:uncharacterized protein YcbK (DUF882 family)
MLNFMRPGALAILVGLLLAGCATSGPQSGAQPGTPRSIAIVHPASGESVTTTYWTGSGYDSHAMSDIAALFRDRRTGEVIPVDPALVDMLADIRDRLNLPPEAPIHLTCGYRSAASNLILAQSNPNVAEHSYHIRGQAVDFKIPGVTADRVGEVAAGLQRGGYAVYPHTGHIHVDTGPFRTWSPRVPGEHRRPDVLEARATAPARAPAPATVRTVVAARAAPAATAVPVSAPAPAKSAAPAPAARPAAPPHEVAQAKPAKGSVQVAQLPTRDRTPDKAPAKPVSHH